MEARKLKRDTVEMTLKPDKGKIEVLQKHNVLTAEMEIVV